MVEVDRNEVDWTEKITVNIGLVDPSRSARRLSTAVTSRP
jgi:hypothetical protein